MLLSAGTYGNRCGCWRRSHADDAVLEEGLDAMEQALEAARS